MEGVHQEANEEWLERLLQELTMEEGGGKGEGEREQGLRSRTWEARASEQVGYGVFPREDGSVR